MADETFDVWPHDPEKIVKEALREYVGDGDGEDERVLAAFVDRIRERIARMVREEAGRAPVMDHQNGYPTQAVPKADLLDLAARIAGEGA